ncbi:MAG: hypothetical protein AAFX51_09140, partial [Cyanobacteria bacterium J06636_28]
MRLLVLSLNTFPYPPSHGAAEVRTFNLLRQIGPLHDITLVAHQTPNATEANIQTLKKWVKEIKLFPLPDKKDPQDRNPLKQALRLAQFVITSNAPHIWVVTSLGCTCRCMVTA